MKELIESLLSDDYIDFKQIVEQRIKNLVEEKLHQVKLRLTAEMYGDVEELDEANIQKMGRTKVVRVRFRSGKIQRRKKLSAVPGYTIRQGRMVRMSSLERRHRKMAARRGKLKRRAEMQQILRKRKRSLGRRKAMGL